MFIIFHYLYIILVIVVNDVELVYNIDEQIAFCVFSYFLGENIRFLVW